MKQQCLKNFLRYAGSGVLGMLGLSCYILADTYYISGWLGTQGLAALNLAIPVYSLIHGSGLMIGMGGASIYTIARSQSDGKRANTVFTLSLILAGLFSAIYMLVGAVFSDQLALLLGADDATFDMSRIYLKMLLLCSPAFLLNDLILAFVRNDGAPRLSMGGMLAGSFSNILLDYLFIYFLRWGMFGAVFATCLAPVISLCVVSSFFFRRRNRFRPIRIQLNADLGAKLLTVGFPSLVTELSSGIVIIVFNLLILGSSGNTGVAAYGIIANISLVVIAVFTGIAQGIQPLLSRHYGCEERFSLRLTMRYAFVSVLLLSVVMYAFLFFWADPIAQLFNSQENAQLQALAVRGMRLYFTGIAFAGSNVVLCMYLSCANRPRAGNVLALLRGFALILPLALLLAEFWQMTGLWLAFPITELSVTLIAAAFLLRKKKVEDSF